MNSCKLLVDSKPAEKNGEDSHAKQQTLICLHTEKWWKSNFGHQKCSALFVKEKKKVETLQTLSASED